MAIGWRYWKLQGYDITPKEFRRAYVRWKAGQKRGLKISIEEYLNNERVQVKKGKSRKYFYAKRALELALATPKWVNKNELLDVYDRCPEGMQVDHIYPINGKKVCGLHVPWNLQYLTKEENMKKSNSEPPIK